MEHFDIKTTIRGADFYTLKNFSSEILCYEEPGKFRLVFEMFMKFVSKQATGFVPELCIL